MGDAVAVGFFFSFLFGPNPLSIFTSFSLVPFRVCSLLN